MKTLIVFIILVSAISSNVACQCSSNGTGSRRLFAQQHGDYCYAMYAESHDDPAMEFQQIYLRPNSWFPDSQGIVWFRTGIAFGLMVRSPNNDLHELIDHVTTKTSVLVDGSETPGGWIDPLMIPLRPPDASTLVGVEYFITLIFDVEQYAAGTHEVIVRTTTLDNRELQFIFSLEIIENEGNCVTGKN